MQTRVALSHGGKAKIDILKIHRLLIIKLYLQTVLLLRASDCANITSGMLPMGPGVRGRRAGGEKVTRTRASTLKRRRCEGQVAPGGAGSGRRDMM